MFDRIKVLELASVLAGPGVGQFFAELGAEVLKVENLKSGGDVTRSWKLNSEGESDISAYFSAINWGKKSIALDLHHIKGKGIVHKLAKWADIVIVSYKPGDAQKLQVDYTTLSTINPGIIYGEITGYGEGSSRVGYDAVLQAETGFMSMNGEAQGPPTKMPVALIDILAAHQLKEGILLAMINRFSTGKGDHVKVSLFDAAIASLANQGANYLVAGKVPGRSGSAHPNIAPYGDIFQTLDGDEIILAIGNDIQFQKLCQVLGIPEISEDVRFSTNPTRVKNREKLKEILKKEIQHFSAEKILSQCHGQKIPAGSINNVRQALEMPDNQTALLEGIRNGDNIQGLPTFVAQFQNMGKSSHFLPPPHFGEHTHSILKDILGLNNLEISDLKEFKVVN